MDRSGQLAGGEDVGELVDNRLVPLRRQTGAGQRLFHLTDRDESTVRERVEFTGAGERLREVDEPVELVVRVALPERLRVCAVAVLVAWRAEQHAAAGDQ